MVPTRMLRYAASAGRYPEIRKMRGTIEQTLEKIKKTSEGKRQSNLGVSCGHIAARTNRNVKSSIRLPASRFIQTQISDCRGRDREVKSSPQALFVKLVAIEVVEMCAIATCQN